MSNIFKDQYDFLRESGQIENKSRDELIHLYIDLIREESDETFTATDELQLLDGAIDLIYVAAGLVNTLIGEDQSILAWDAVHVANMRKLATKQVREDGKVIKSDEWKQKEKQRLDDKLTRLLDNYHERMQQTRAA